MNFKVGDKVRVVKRVEEEEGWENDWAEGMNTYIGNIYTIAEIEPTGIYFIEIENTIDYGFPPSSLEKVE